MTKKTYIVKKTISPEVDRHLKKYLSNELHQNEDDTFSITTVFENGIAMDIKCCGVQDENEPSWTEAVLFNKNGHELMCSDIDDTFTGIWELSYNGTTYITNVQVE